MANLFQIDRAIESLIDPETGEITDPAAFESLALERPRKIEAVANAIRNALADGQACLEQSKTFKSRADSYLKKAQSLTDYLSAYLNHSAYESPNCSITFRRSESVEVDESLVPTQYLVEKTTYSPDKKAIRADIKSGADIPGCKLVEKFNPTIK